MSELKVITLAAGKGTRLGEASRGLPKCMATLGGRTLLEWQRLAFDQNKLRSRQVVVRDGVSLPLTSNEKAIEVCGEGGPMDSLFAALPENRSTTVIACYGDIVFHPEIVKSLLEAQGDICVIADLDWHTLWSMRFDSVLDDAERFRASGTSITDIGGRASNSADIQAQFIGMMKLSPLGFDQLDGLRRPGDDSTSLLARAIVEGVPITATFITGRWCEVDTERDLDCYRHALSHSDSWSHDWRQH